MGDGSKVAMVLTHLRGIQFDLLPDRPRKKAIGDGSSSPGEEEDLEGGKGERRLRIRGRSSVAQQNLSTSSQTYVIGPTTSSRAADLHVRTDIEEAAMMRENRGE